LKKGEMMKIKVVKKGTSKGKPSRYCPWVVDDWKGPAT
jgi:hypothetical protein